MRHINYVIIISFLAIILAIPILGIIEQDNEYSIVENRKLQTFPDLLEDGIKGFTGGFENYAVDQFPGRNSMLDIYTKMQLLINKIRIRNTIIIEDWLFIRDYSINENKVKHLSGIIGEAVRTYENTKFNYVIFPSKTAALAELYPIYIDGKISENNNEKLKENFMKVEKLSILNVYKIMIDQYSIEERKDFYYKTDFHWNAEGAFNAFKVITTHLKGHALFNKSEAKLKRIEFSNKYFSGDLERRFSGNIKNNDIPNAYEIIDPNDLIYYTSIDEEEQVARKEIIATNIRKDVIGYNDVYAYNLSCIRIINKNPLIDEKAIIFKDSYFNAMVDPISTIFSETIIIDPRYYNEDYTFSEIMNLKNPDHIFFCYHQSNVDEALINLLK